MSVHVLSPNLAVLVDRIPARKPRDPAVNPLMAGDTEADFDEGAEACFFSAGNCLRLSSVFSAIKESPMPQST